MSNGVEEIDNVQLMREVGNEEDEITPYGAHCVADELESLRTQLAQERQRREQAEGLLRRYRDKTPLGHQPHMISEEVDKHFGEWDGN